MKKSETELRFNELADKYYEKFGKDYPYMITSAMTLEDVCADIEKCLKTGKPKKDYPYKKGADY